VIPLVLIVWETIVIPLVLLILGNYRDSSPPIGPGNLLWFLRETNDIPLVLLVLGNGDSFPLFGSGTLV
jgi:hypothetical protein